MAIATIVLLVLLLVITTLLAAAVGKLGQLYQSVAGGMVATAGHYSQLASASSRASENLRLIGAEIRASKEAVDALAQKADLVTEGSAAANVRIAEVQKALIVLHKLYVEQQDLLAGVGQLVVNTNQLTRMVVASKSDEQVH